MDEIFDKSKIDLAIKEPRLWEKVLLWFRPWTISTDWNGEDMRATLFAKELFGKIYILEEKLES